MSKNKINVWKKDTLIREQTIDLLGGTKFELKELENFDLVK